MSSSDRWLQGDAYEAFMGRWSRRMAERFIEWLSPESGLAWLDIRCGTGALTSAILERVEPSSVVACDPSEAFVEHVRTHVEDPRLSTVVAGAGSLPERQGGFDVIVSGLVLNFVPDPLVAVREMKTRASDEGTVAAYLWDYEGKMEFLRFFWEEAVARAPSVADRDEARRFPMFHPEPLEAMFTDAGLGDVTSAPIEIDTRFESFSHYWEPFLGGVGPAGAYVASLGERDREELRTALERRLAPDDGGTIDLVARAWAIRGSRHR